MRDFARALAVATLGVMPFAAVAQDNLVVVELFTSQGCSSCPPADEILGALASRNDVIALALHVDYWDYIGWKDDFADPRFTRRQQQYAIAAGERTVYTPQFIIGGASTVVGAHSMEVLTAVEDHKAEASPVALRVVRTGNTIEIMAEATARRAGPMMVQLVRFVPAQTVEIGRGENAGRTIDYHNIVTDWQVVGDWNGNGTFSKTVQLQGNAKGAVIVQQGGYGPILAAARTD